jgi:hypothetical protein
MKPNRVELTAVAIFVAVLGSGCASTDSRLIGRWRSNRPLSVSTFAVRNRLTPAKRALFDSIFGKFTLTYTSRYIDTEMPSKDAAQPYRQRIPYRVVASDAESVTIVAKDSPGFGESTKRIHFVGQKRYWISVGSSAGREYFDRLE